MKQDNHTEEITLKELVFNIKDWYTYAITKWKVILIATIVGALLGLTYSLVKKPTYKATLTFALEDDGSGGGLGGALGLASQFGVDLSGGNGGGIFSSSNLIELFRSRTMVEKALLLPVDSKDKKVSLADFYIQEKGWKKKWEENPKLKNIKFLPGKNRENFSREQDSILGAIYEDLSKDNFNVDQKDKMVSIITIDVLSTNESFSKQFAESLAFVVSEFYINTKNKKSRINMDILKFQTDSIRRELNGAITGAAIATDNTFNLNPALNVRRTPFVKKQTDVQANTAILTELVKQTELAKVAVRKDTPLIQIIDRPILPLKKEGLGKVKGIVLGGFLFGFLSVLFVCFKRYFNN